VIKHMGDVFPDIRKRETKLKPRQLIQLERGYELAVRFREGDDCRKAAKKECEGMEHK
jgi:hypothetical protein